MTTRSAVAADELTSSGDFLVAYRRLEMSMATSLSTTPSFQLANGNVVSLDPQSRGRELLKDVRSKIASFCDTLVSGSLCSAFESKRYLAPDQRSAMRPMAAPKAEAGRTSSNRYWTSHSMEAETEGIAMAAPAAEDMPPSSAASFNETFMMDERNRVVDLLGDVRALVEQARHELENPVTLMVVCELIAILDSSPKSFSGLKGSNLAFSFDQVHDLRRACVIMLSASSDRGMLERDAVETLSHSFDLGLVLAAALENPTLALLISEAILDAVDTKFRTVAGVSQGTIDELKLQYALPVMMATTSFMLLSAETLGSNLQCCEEWQQL
ncbi:hypothetical protein JCM1840_000214 [Sporobolomyces johnsonii]